MNPRVNPSVPQPALRGQDPTANRPQLVGLRARLSFQGPASRTVRLNAGSLTPDLLIPSIRPGQRADSPGPSSVIVGAVVSSSTWCTSPQPVGARHRLARPEGPPWNAS